MGIELGLQRGADIPHGIKMENNNQNAVPFLARKRLGMDAARASAAAGKSARVKRNVPKKQKVYMVSSSGKMLGTCDENGANCQYDPRAMLPHRDAFLPRDRVGTKRPRSRAIPIA